MGFQPAWFAVVFLLSVGALLLAIGIGTPEWGAAKVLGVKVTRGLWQYCVAGDCIAIPESQKSDWFKAVRGSASIGIVASGLSVFVATIKFIYDIVDRRSPKMVGGLVALLSLITFIAIINAAIIMAVKEMDFNYQEKSKFKPGYSFGLSVTGAVVTLIGGGAAGCNGHT